jgi:hypothetical protein
MWTPLVNGQPFFFQSDSTNYVRAADSAVYLATGGRFSTVWTDRYRAQMEANKAAPSTSAQPAPPHLEGVNDVGHGFIMAGRSPYIGALMYVGYLLGDFWPFVLLQSLVAYALIILTLRRFDVATPANVTLVTLGLAATTALPTYNGLLLADAFAAFGMLAFLLLATPGKLTKLEQVFLGLVLIVSVTSHLTHIMILLGMTAALALWWVVKRIPSPPSRAWIAGIGAVCVGLLSVQITTAVTTAAFGHRPQLLPLLTARFIADGPGKKYIDAGCPGHDFQICHTHIGNPHFDTAILYATSPKDGTYMLANSDQRRLMGEQDVPFALAVLEFDPGGELAMMARNTVRQFLWIDYDGLNQDCFDRPDCWSSLPPTIRGELRASPSGRGLWPQEWMNALLYVVVAASLIVLAASWRPLLRDAPERSRVLREWLLLGLAGMLVCSFFGGAISDPQYRYQGRLIWLVPLMAAVALLILRQVYVRTQHSAVDVGHAPTADAGAA